MRLLCFLAGLLAIGTTSSVAAPQIPASELPGRERERFIDRPGENLLLPRQPTTVLPWQCRVHVTRNSRMKIVRYR